MRQPSTSAAMYLRMSAGARFVLFNSSLQVSSVLNRATELPITATAAPPTWNGSGLAGPFLATNFPGATGIAALNFASASSQFLRYDTLSGLFSGTENPITVCALVSCSTPASGTAQTVWGFGNASTTKLALQYLSGNLRLTETNGSGTFTTSNATDNGVHCITAIRANNTLTLRVDGVQVGTITAITSNTEAFTTFCIGGLDTGGTVSLFFNGNVSDVIAFGAGQNGGMADIIDTETFLMKVGGVIQ